MDEQQKKNMGELAALMYEDAEMKPLIDKWTEEKFPGVHSRVQSTKAVEKGVAAIEAKTKEFETRMAAREAAEARRRNIEAIQHDPTLKIRDDEVAEVEKLMMERRIGTYEDAAHRYRQIHQVAAPRPTSSLAMEVPGLSGAGGDDTAWLKPAFSNLGDKSILDRVARARVDQIRADFAAGRGSKWE